MLRTPISKPARTRASSLLPAKFRKKRAPGDLNLQFQQIQQSLRVAISALNPSASFEETPQEIESPLTRSRSECLENLRNSGEKPRLSEILALEAGVDEALLECMARITRISHFVKNQALQGGLFI